MNFTLLSVTELPGYALSYFGMQYWGRKVTIYYCVNLLMNNNKTYKEILFNLFKKKY